jgi:AcrR family transcriptional regulator
MERARELLAQGGSVRQVAKAVGVSRGTLLRRLKEKEE